MRTSKGGGGGTIMTEPKETRQNMAAPIAMQYGRELSYNRHELPVRVQVGRWLALFMDADHPHHRAEYRLVAVLFLRLLALVYLAAFASIGIQIAGLAGPEGLLPAVDMLLASRETFWQHPTLFWLDASGPTLEGAAWLGCILAVALFFNMLPRLCLGGLFVLYLSLMHTAPLFMDDTGDHLLLEAGFLAIFLVWGTSVIRLYRWLMFRLLFLSGAAKVLGQNAGQGWTDLTALDYFFETQPLPHVGAWLAHHWPESVLHAAGGIILFTELVGAFFLFLPRGPRFLTAWALIAVQGGLLLTGNHGLVNVLVLALYVLLFDDRALKRVVPWPLLHMLFPWRPPVRGGWGRAPLVAGMAGIAGIVGGVQILEALSGHHAPPPLATFMAAVQPFHLVNAYKKAHALWPATPSERLELAVEGSNDGIHWRSYIFAYKPGELEIRPPLTVLHQPRLDRLMVAATRGDAAAEAVASRVLPGHLLRGNRTVTALLARDPFFGSRPRWVRRVLYRYRFTDPDTRAVTGHWWKRAVVHVFPPGI